MSTAPRTVIITGAAGNLGQAVAQAFAQLGDRLVLVDRNADALQQLYGPDTATQMCVPANLLDRAQVNDGIQKAVDRLGSPSVLCHLAGGFRMGDDVHSTDDSTLEFLFNINVHSLMPVAACVVPRMVEAGGGKIITVGAMGALRGGAQMGAYAASKSALMRLTESMSAEVKSKHINVNCVMPSIIDTPENRAAMPDADPAQWVAPGAIADVLVFLASTGARAIHGACIPIAGLS